MELELSSYSAGASGAVVYELNCSVACGILVP